ncbi:Secretory carrier-associated membrane protein 1 [Platanthera zijinensis]|uniref:Secretory carrier-associated membrane protein 1 n=1 Tax=Platanthera zijinensis TaxID=2320716 RepID=A0AAP0BIB1_9ASPA
MRRKEVREGALHIVFCIFAAVTPPIIFKGKSLTGREKNPCPSRRSDRSHRLPSRFFPQVVVAIARLPRFIPPSPLPLRDAGRHPCRLLRGTTPPFLHEAVRLSFMKKNSLVRAAVLLPCRLRRYLCCAAVLLPCCFPGLLACYHSDPRLLLACYRYLCFSRVVLLPC